MIQIATFCNWHNYMLCVALLNKQHLDEMFKMVSKCMQLKLTIDIWMFFMHNNFIIIENNEIYETYMLHNIMIHKVLPINTTSYLICHPILVILSIRYTSPELSHTDNIPFSSPSSMAYITSCTSSAISRNHITINLSSSWCSR